MLKYLGFTGEKEQKASLQEIIEKFFELNQQVNKMTFNANENFMAIDEKTPDDLLILKFISGFISSQLEHQLSEHAKLKEAFKNSNKECGNLLNDDLTEFSKEIPKLSEDNFNAFQSIKVIGERLNIVSESVLATAKLLEESKNLTQKMQKDPSLKIEDTLRNSSENFRGFFTANKDKAVNQGWRKKITAERQERMEEESRLKKQVKNKDQQINDKQKQVAKLKQKRANEVKNRRKGGRH